MSTKAKALLLMGLLVMTLAGFSIIGYDVRGIVAVVAAVTLAAAVIVECVEKGIWK